MLFGERETTSDFHDNYAMKQKRKGGKQPSAITVITIMWGSGSAWQQYGGLVFQDLCLKKPRTAVIRNAWQWRRFLDEWWICGNDFGDWQLNVSTTSRSWSTECLSRWHHRIHNQTGGPHSVIRNGWWESPCDPRAIRHAKFKERTRTWVRPSITTKHGPSVKTPLRTTNSGFVGSTLPTLSLFHKSSVGYYDPGT